MPRQESDRSSFPMVAVMACAIGLPLLLYFGLFAAILIDEAVLHTYYFSSNTPDWVGDAMRTIYWPLIGPFQ